MNEFAVEAIPQVVADYVRANGRDPIWGHAAVLEEVASGFGPCRLCLRTFDGEARLLFTHDTYTGVSEFPQPGPVYIHADVCPRYGDEGFPPDLRPLSLTFEAVARGPRVVALERTNGESPDEVIARLLAAPDVEYINLRNSEAGCFVARVTPLPT